MGQRHQLFVIARVGNHYRSLAVIHHQWLYGMSALRSCLRLLRIFSDPSNRNALKAELDLAVGFFRDQGPPPSEPPEYEDPEKKPCPFPFITTCLVVGAAYDSEMFRVNTVSELAYNMGFDMGDNNDGITVLDVTDPAHVRYCFVNFFDNCTPLTGREYVKGYYDESDAMMRNNIATVEGLDKSPLIGVESLAETWPWGGWMTGDEAARPQEPDYQLHLRNPTKSLQDLADAKLFPLILHSTDDDFDPSLLDEVRVLPRFQSALKEYLVSNPEQVGSTKSSLYLLQLAYAGEPFLAWNNFENLTPNGISAALASDELKGATGISLATRIYDSPSELVKVFSSPNFPRELMILDRPDRQDEQLSEQIFEAIAELQQPIAIKQVTLSGPYSHGVRQNIWRPYRNNPRTPEAYPVVQILMAHKGTDFDGMSMEYFPLGDTALSPVKVVTGLFQYLMTQIRNYPSRNGTGLEAAHCFSSGASALGNAHAFEISPLPAEIYKVAKEGYHSSIFAQLRSKMRDLTPDAWTVVVSKSSSTVWSAEDKESVTDLQFEYAFVRPKLAIKVAPKHWRGSPIQPSEVEVVDFQGFLGLTAPEVDTSKLVHHFDQLGVVIEKDMGDGNRIINTADTPALCLLGPDEACGLLNQFVAAVPKTQKVAAKAQRWESPSHWVHDLGFKDD